MRVLLAMCLIMVGFIVVTCVQLQAAMCEIPTPVPEGAREKTSILRHRTIFQTVASLKQTSPRLREIMHGLRVANPTWECRIFEDQDIDAYVRLHWAGTREEKAFFSISRDYGPARADLWRYMVVYENGGFYADAKTMCTTTLDDILKTRRHGDEFAVLHYWLRNYESRKFMGNTMGELGQYFLLYSAGHPFLRAVLDRVVANIEAYNFEKDGGGKTAVLKLTGPYAYTKAIEGYLSVHSDEHHSFLSLDAEIQYSAFYNRGVFDGAHEAMYGRVHYSRLTTPIVHK
jgi:mannosyltransferase OCH1-like enzyme